MSLVPSLLQAIVRVDGEALVMHAGDKPYVVSPTGQIDLANRGLTLDAVSGIVNQMLPAEMQQALTEFGAIQYELPPMPEFPASISPSWPRAAGTICGPRSDGIVCRTTTPCPRSCLRPRPRVRWRSRRSRWLPWLRLRRSGRLRSRPQSSASLLPR
jgi:hypothetical protein